MAKTTKEVKKFEFSKVNTILDNIAKNVSITIDREIKPKQYISTGSLTLNAALSGSIYGGISVPGISVFGGPEATGKTFLALNIMREAMKEDYSVIWIDTEHAIRRDELESLGIDNNPDKFVIIRGNQIEELNITCTSLIDELKKAKLAGYELPKQIWCLDSVGQLASRRMKEDLIKGDIKADVGNKAKALSSFFVSITEDLAGLGIPFVCNNQVYETMEIYSQTVMRGGKQLYYSANTITFLTKAKLKEDADDLDIGGSSGIIVTARCVKNRKVKPKQVKFEISFDKGMNKFKGLENFLRPEFFEKTGIAQGKMEVDKSTGEMRFVPGGIRWYVRHLDKSVYTSQLFNNKVFTKEVLDAVDEICQSYFKYKSLSEMEEIDNQYSQIQEEVGNNMEFKDDFDAEDLFK